MNSNNAELGGKYSRLLRPRRRGKLPGGRPCLRVADSTVSDVDEIAEECASGYVKEVVRDESQFRGIAAIDEKPAIDKLDGLFKFVSEAPECKWRYLTLSICVLAKPTVCIFFFWLLNLWSDRESLIMIIINYGGVVRLSEIASGVHGSNEGTGIIWVR